MNYVQITPEILVPERTAELASRMPGVLKVLKMGIVVMHYEDWRELEARVHFRGEAVRKSMGS